MSSTIIDVFFSNLNKELTLSLEDMYAYIYNYCWLNAKKQCFFVAN